MHSGTRIGHYEIAAPIGAGGMGEVFRARDTRLNRDVAVKVSPKDFVADADRLRRFEQGAKALAVGLAKLRANPKSEIPNSRLPVTATLPIDLDAFINTTEPGIFAFGCVLYEMLSGMRAFRRDTPVARMNAVLSEEPPELAAIKPDAPLRVKTSGRIEAARRGSTVQGRRHPLAGA